MKVLNPGGIIEVHGLVFHPYAQEGKVPEVIQEWVRELYKLTEKRGTPIDVTSSYKTWMEAAGFEKIRTVSLSLPLGTWAQDERQKETGMLNLEATMWGIEAYSMMPLVEAGWSEVEATVQIAKVRNAYLKNCGENQLYSKVVIFTGRKPAQGNS